MLITLETAELAKEKGFKLTQRIITTSPLPEESNGSFTDVKGVSQSLLQKWFREEYKINVIVLFGFENYSVNVFQGNNLYYGSLITNTYFESYEDALEHGLQVAFKIN